MQTPNENLLQPWKVYQKKVFSVYHNFEERIRLKKSFSHYVVVYRTLCIIINTQNKIKQSHDDLLQDYEKHLLVDYPWKNTNKINTAVELFIILLFHK